MCHFPVAGDKANYKKLTNVIGHFKGIVCWCVAVVWYYIIEVGILVNVEYGVDNCIL